MIKDLAVKELTEVIEILENMDTSEYNDEQKKNLLNAVDCLNKALSEIENEDEEDDIEE